MDTRQKILDSAQRLIQTRSYHGFSFQDVAEEVGVRKASLYHYFGSKDDVALAVLERGKHWVASQLEKADGLEPTERLERYFDMARLVHHKGKRMCPAGSFASVIDAVSQPVQRALHDFTVFPLDWLEKTVSEGVERGDFRIGDQRPRDVALQIFATVQGALLTGRLISDAHVLDNAVVQLRSYLGYVPKDAQQTPLAPAEAVA